MRNGILFSLSALCWACYDPVYGLAEGESLGGGSGGAVCEEAVGEIPTYTADIEPIIQGSCALSGCHAAGGSSPALDGGYESLVGPDASTGIALISSEDPAASYIWMKIDGCTNNHLDCVGSQMPLGGELSEEELALIQAWICGGVPQ